MPPATVRTDPRLWELVRQKWLRSESGGVAGKWNARKAMLAVQEYKRRGGRYVGPRAANNSLKKWEREQWGYIDGDATGRYLPAAVRAALTAAEKRREKRLKRGRPGEWVPYSASVNAKMRRAGIYGRRAMTAPLPKRRMAAPPPKRRMTAPPPLKRRMTAPPPPKRRATTALKRRMTAPPKRRATTALKRRATTALKRRATTAPPAKRRATTTALKRRSAAGEAPHHNAIRPPKRHMTE